MSNEWYYAGESAYGQLNDTGTPFTDAEADAIDRERGKGKYQTYTAPTAQQQAAPTPTPPVSPWNAAVTYQSPKGIKQAEPDVVIQNDDVESPELMTQLFFEEMGGVELISVSRSDIIDGVPVTYNPIANLSALRQRFNPNNIIATSSRESDYFKRFGIDLSSRGYHTPYFDDSGNLVIEVDLIGQNEIIELDIAQTGTMNRITL